MQKQNSDRPCLPLGAKITGCVYLHSRATAVTNYAASQRSRHPPQRKPPLFLLNLMANCRKVWELNTNTLKVKHTLAVSPRAQERPKYQKASRNLRGCLQILQMIKAQSKEENGEQRVQVCVINERKRGKRLPNNFGLIVLITANILSPRQHFLRTLHLLCL